MYETIRITTDRRGVATLTLNRPEKHNAMSAQMLADLSDAAAKLGTDDSVRVVVLTGEGKSFCAGGDLYGERLANHRPFVQQDAGNLKSVG